MQKLYKKSVSGDREIYLGEVNNEIYSRRVRNEHIYVYKDHNNNEEIKGWTIDKDACEQTVFAECKYIMITNSDTNIGYWVSVSEFMKNAISLRDRYFLALDKFMEMTDEKPFKRIDIIKVDK